MVNGLLGVVGALAVFASATPAWLGRGVGAAGDSTGEVGHDNVVRHVVS